MKKRAFQLRDYGGTPDSNGNLIPDPGFEAASVTHPGKPAAWPGFLTSRSGLLEIRVRRNDLRRMLRRGAFAPCSGLTLSDSDPPKADWSRSP